MKKLLPLIVLVLLLTATTALAASIPGQQSIIAVNDATGAVVSLTDDDASTAWVQSAESGSTLTLNLSGASVGEVWIRNGYAYTQNWYSHYDRPSTVKVTVYYRANQYTTSYDFFRYTLKDTYQPNARTEDWNGGYQRLLLPKRYTGVTKIELTIEGSVRGYGNAGLAISDVAVSTGTFVSATPKANATATPKPYVVYVTPSPAPSWSEPTQTPDWRYDVTPTPVVELITPTPAPTKAPTPAVTSEPVVYPSDTGVVATLSQKAATRSGPSNRYDEPGTFFSAGHEVKVITKAWDSENDLWWFQIEFKYDGEWYRAYTTETRVDIDPAVVATEPTEPIETLRIPEDVRSYFGPGANYRCYRYAMIYEGYDVKVFNIENGWAQIEYIDYALDGWPVRRTWIPQAALYGE